MNQVATIDQNQKAPSLLRRMGQNYGVDENKLLTTLKNTAFKIKNGEATNEQMMALLIVADQHGLNPFTKEIYAFEDSHKGVVPVVGVDGWARIINSHKQFDGMDFDHDAESCTCRMYRKDRSHPIEVTEYLDECKRNTGPWNSHPRRMLRHKAMIQCARVAFSFSGIYDEDEAERIVYSDDRIIDAEPTQPARPALQQLEEGKLDSIISDWSDTIESGDSTTEDVVSILSSKYELTEDQVARIHAMAIEGGEA